MSRPRRLVGTRRTVSPADRAEYDALWAALHREATARGAHAWRFRGADDEASFLEFLEFDGVRDPRSAMEGVLREMEARFPGTAEEWDDASEF